MRILQSLFFSLFLFAVTIAYASVDVVEVASEVAFVPKMGFDDNDNVTVVLHGFLPNACFTIGNHVIERKKNHNEIRIRQFAVRRRDGVCGQQELPLHLAALVPFTEDVSVGILPEGSYSIQYWKDARKGVGVRNFQVERAPTIDQDTFPYASTSSVMVSDIVREGDHVRATISGILTSGCQELPERINVQRIDDVYVALPTLNIKRNVMCTESIRPFSRTIELGAPREGHYLLHVRSMNGKAVSRVFEVVSN